MVDLKFDGIFEDNLKGYDLLLKEYQQLEKELKEARRSNYVMNGLLNGEEKKIVKDLQKLKDMQDECDTCMKQEFELNRLEKENAELKEKLSKWEVNNPKSN